MIDFSTEAPERDFNQNRNQPERKDTMSEENTKPAFRVGETYATRSIGDNDCIYSATVIRRTAQTVTFRERGRGEYTCRISKGLSEFNGCEAVYPHGRHSMCPTFTADRTLADVTGKRTVRVAVYGTLMQGERNAHWADEAGARVLGEGTVLGWLWDTGWGYPAIQTCGHLMRVAVEVLETDEDGLAHMDVLEGYPNLYGREKVCVTLADGREVDALIYEMRDMGEKSNRFTLIEPVDGVADWREYRKAREVRA